MKYLTKEWYKISNLTDLHFDLEAIDEAADKDDDLFRSLYEDKEYQFVEEDRAEYDFDPRELFDEGYFPEDFDMQEFLVEEAAFVEQTISDYDNREPFSEEYSKKIFAQIYDLRLKQIQEDLPKEIYKQIADPRVFALGFTTSEIYEAVRDFSVQNNRYTQKILEEYEEIARQQNIPRSLRQRLDFHDCKIIGWLTQGTDLVLTLDNEGGFTDDNRITFRDVTVLNDENILNLFWIYEELYKTKDGYEIHILCDGDRLAELSLLCSDIRIEEI